MAGTNALRQGDPAGARPYFEQVVSARPADLGAWFGLAIACRGLADIAGQLRALDQVLAADPGHLPALLMKADHFAAVGDGRAAASYYRAVVDRAPPLDRLPPDLSNEVRRAEAQCKFFSQQFEAHLRGELVKAGFDAATGGARFAESLDLLLGKKQVYFQSPTSYYFPGLPQRQFYERDEFTWLPALESKTRLIRDELLSVVRDDRAIEPYVRANANRPPSDYAGLQDNLDWSAFYLIRDGVVVADNAARCPATMAALQEVPLARIPGQTPAVLFSLLRPSARIPAHTGMFNTRLICHLPLVVPEGCGFRVGNEMRQWVEGQTLVFDDSIEHEAWNDSGHLRGVLLFEIWRPELSEDERNRVAALLATVRSFSGALAD
jgi:aspartate beta-hydroxylase